MASTIFGSFEFNFRKTEFFINRAYTLTAGQLKIQSQKEIGAMSARHQAEIVKAQQPVTKYLSNKFAAGDATADLKNALDRIVDIRNSLFEARAAAKLGVICPYKVIISLIDKQQVDDFVRRNGITLVDGDIVATFTGTVHITRRNLEDVI